MPTRSDGAERPSRGTLKVVLQALAGVDEVPSEADAASQADEPTEAVEADVRVRGRMVARGSPGLHKLKRVSSAKW